MKVSTLTRTLLLLAFTTLLAACGGGGGSGDDSGFNPPGARLSVSPATVSVNTNSGVSVTLRATGTGGASVPDGTSVTATVSPSSLGNVSAVGSGTAGVTATATTSGGNAVFFFQSGGQTGSGSLNFSMVDPNTPGRTVTTSTSLQVNAGAGNDPRISCDPSKTQIPVNADDVPFFYGSPYIAETVWTLRSATGQPIQDDGSGPQAVQFAISPSERGSVSVDDDPSTPENETATRMASVFTGVSSGIAKAYVWSRHEPGTLTLTASFTDPDTGQRVVGTCVFEVVSSAPPLPAAVTVFDTFQNVYIRASGGNQSSVFQVFVADGNGAGVPDPQAGNQAWNNVMIEIIAGPTNADASLSGINAAGQVVTGQQVSLATTDGIATPTLRAGDTPGSYTIRATADAADNNVDNGIQDPVHGTFTFVIGDGRLFSIELAVPGADSVFENLVIDDEGVITENPDGTYSVTVTAIATDRQGNPVLPGTPINFGLIDDPQSGFPVGGGGFDISGPDGNPQEAGTLFTAPTGQFLTAGGGAGPGDTLVLFAEEVTGNRDHEAARTVASVNSQTSLSVTRRFNRNDDTGFIVDSGPVIPYVVGRATSATIPSSAATNELGIATTRYTFPVSQLGKPVIVWAQGEADIVNGVAETAADVEVLSFFGIAPGTLVVSPNPIPGNRTVEVQACVFDANLNPFQGVQVAFQFSGLAGGTGSIDGVSTSGVMPQATGTNGCATGTLVTSGVPATAEGGPVVTFSAVGETVEVPIVVNVALLTANPTFVLVPEEGTEVAVALQLLDDQGLGVPSVVINTACTDNLVVLTEAGQTNADGRASVRIQGCGFLPGDTGTCTYTAVTGQQAHTTFAAGGSGFSPPYTGCTDAR